MTDGRAMPVLAAQWPYTPTRLDDVLSWSQILHGRGYGRLWLGQSAVMDTAAAVAYAAGAGANLAVGLAVQVMPLHSPASTAQQLRALAAACGREVPVCFSPGDPIAQQVFAGRRYRSPLTAAREFLTALRAQVEGAPLQQRGEYFSFDGQLTCPPPDHTISLGLGTLRPKMAELAGEVADLAVTWLTPPDYVQTVLVPALDRGAATAGRARPRLVVPVHAALAAPGRRPEVLAQTALGHHLQGEHYRRMLEAAGERGALRTGAAGALESGLMTYGSAADIADRVIEVAAAGADEISLVLHQPRLPWPAAREEWISVGEQVADRLAQAADARGWRPATARIEVGA